MPGVSCFRSGMTTSRKNFCQLRSVRRFGAALRKLCKIASSYFSSTGSVFQCSTVSGCGCEGGCGGVKFPTQPNKIKSPASALAADSAEEPGRPVVFFEGMEGGSPRIADEAKGPHAPIQVRWLTAGLVVGFANEPCIGRAIAEFADLGRLAMIRAGHATDGDRGLDQYHRSIEIQFGDAIERCVMR